MRTVLATLPFILSFISIFGQTEQAKLRISHLSGDFYIFTTYHLYKESQVSANGMYLLTDEGVVMFDTPWDTAQFQPLLDSIQFKHHKKVLLCISTDFHADRTGGLEFYRNRGIKTYTTKKIDELSLKSGMKRAEFLIYQDSSFRVGQYTFQTYFPGEGHTASNIIIWFGKEKILYGGCLIKSADAEDLGYLGDANVKAYATTIRNVQAKCKNPRFVIPGHGDWTNTKSLEHTLNLARQIQN